MSIVDVGCCVLAAFGIFLLAFFAELLRQLWPILARLDAENLGGTDTTLSTPRPSITRQKCPGAPH